MQSVVRFIRMRYSITDEFVQNVKDENRTPYSVAP